MTYAHKTARTHTAQRSVCVKVHRRLTGAHVEDLLYGMVCRELAVECTALVTVRILLVYRLFNLLLPT